MYLNLFFLLKKSCRNDKNNLKKNKTGRIKN